MGQHNCISFFFLKRQLDAKQWSGPNSTTKPSPSISNLKLDGRKVGAGKVGRGQGPCICSTRTGTQ